MDSRMDIEAVRTFVKEQIAYLKDDSVPSSEIADDQPLFEEGGTVGAPSLDLDSLDAVELALALESEFNIGTPEDIDLREFKTVNDVVQFVVALMGDVPQQRPGA